ncbi:MAG: TyrR/PhhR family helix-turn-helix DNA-binding protein, partial [Bacillota bacterium]
INRLVQVPKTTSTNMVIEKEKNSEEDVKLLEILSKSEFEILKTYKEKYKTTRKIAQALGLSQTAVVKKLRKYNL